MTAALYSAGDSHARALIGAGHVDRTSSWSFTGSDGDALLGAKGDDWQSYGAVHLGVDRSAADNTKARWKYPVAKDGKVYRSGLIAAKSRAAQQGDDAVARAAGALLDLVDKPKANDGAAGASSLVVAAEFKFANASAPGAFDGYASVFGVRDGGDDVVAPGAFTDTLAERKAQGRSLPMYMMHGRRLGADPRPVGVWDQVSEDDRGLKSSGHLVGLDTETGKYNHALVKEGAMRGLSIGYRALKTAPMRMGTTTVREIKQAALFEISIVDDPMNAQARMLSVKAADRITTIRDYESFLRDEGGFSHARARAIAEHGFKSSEPRDEDGAMNGLLATLVSTRRSIRKHSS